jgi:hypothetical protein
MVALSLSYSRFDSYSGSLDIHSLYTGSLFWPCINTLCLSLVVYLHRNVLEPSRFDTATVYLIFSVLGDLIILTLPNPKYSRSEAATKLVIFRCIAHSIWLLIDLVGVEGHGLSSEEDYGILSRIFLSWIIPIISYGRTQTLTIEMLPSINQKLKPGHTRREMLKAWHQRG